MSGLGRIRAYTQAATPWPWAIDDNYDTDAWWLNDHIVDAGGQIVAHTQRPYRYEEARANAEFIAQARTDLPLLLDIAEKAAAFDAHFLSRITGRRTLAASPDSECARDHRALREALERLERT